MQYLVTYFRQYLRGREDTVRCIVMSLTDDSSSDLAEELVKGGTISLCDSDTDDDNEDWENWQPDPIDAQPGKYNNKISP